MFPSPYGENYSLTFHEYFMEYVKNEFPSPYGENYSLTCLAIFNFFSFGFPSPYGENYSLT